MLKENISTAYLFLLNDNCIGCNERSLESFKYSDIESIQGKSPLLISPTILPDCNVSKEKALERGEIASFKENNSDFHHEYLSRLVSGIAHQANTPLGNLLTSLSLLKSCINDESYCSKLEMKNKCIDIMDSSILKLIQLIEELKCSSIAHHPEKKQWISISDFTLLLNHNLKKKINNIPIDYNFKIEREEDFTIQIYLINLLLVFERLIENIFDHNTQVDPEINISCIHKNSKIEFSIKNTGSPVSSEMIAKAFEPFSTSNPGSHFGLGLFVVSNIVRNLFGGEIEIKSSRRSTEIIIRWSCLFR